MQTTNDAGTTASQTWEEMAQGLWHGAAYYPELWPELSLEEEVERMRAVGINVVRIGEFAWQKMEPTEGDFDFSFFGEVLDRLQAVGMPVILGTPTATPPVWLTHGHPERCLMDEQGRVMVHGGRQHLAVDEPYVRDRCLRIVDRMAAALGQHPSVLAWQVDNEFKCDVDGDFGPSARKQWALWLEKRYGAVEQLNEAWGTGIWSQAYQNFGQVPAPHKCSGLHNPSLLLAWKRFGRDRVVEFLRDQITVIRKHSSRPITHNLGLFFRIDPVRTADELDFVSFDHYADDQNYRRMVLNFDYWRNRHASRRFWLMETSCSHNGSLLGFHKPHRPGFLRALGAAAYALGAAGFSTWVWRQQRSGPEITHGCTVQAWGTPAIGHAGLQALETVRKRLEPILRGMRPAVSDVGLAWSDEARMMIEVEPHNGLLYQDLLLCWHERLRGLGFHLDVISPGDDLAGKRLLLTPFLPFLSEEFLASAERFVRAGGIWLAGPLTGGRTGEHTVRTDAALGRLENLAGVRTIHTCPLSDSGAQGEGNGMTFDLGEWSHLLEPVDAEPVGIIHGGPAPGLAFLTERALGAGRILVLGSDPKGPEGARFLEQLIKRLARQARVQHRFASTPGTVVAPWKSQDREVRICVNLDGMGGEIWLDRAALELTTGESSPGGFEPIPAYGMRCWEMESASSNPPSGEQELAGTPARSPRMVSAL